VWCCWMRAEIESRGEVSGFGQGCVANQSRGHLQISNVNDNNERLFMDYMSKEVSSHNVLQSIKTIVYGASSSPSALAPKC
jgi:hypothetical protein